VRELRWRDVEHAHELSAERHHDHEVQNVRELHGAEGQQRREFATLGQGVVLGRSGHERRENWRFSQKRNCQVAWSVGSARSVVGSARSGVAVKAPVRA
jgi:hypothetical protein